MRQDIVLIRLAERPATGERISGGKTAQNKHERKNEQKHVQYLHNITIQNFKLKFQIQRKNKNQHKSNTDRTLRP